MKTIRKRVLSLFTAMVMVCSLVICLPEINIPANAATSSNWVWPTYYHSIQNDWPNYSSGSYHGGTDFPVSLNTPVYSSCDGEVVAVTSLTTSYGKHIKIRATVNGSTVYIRYCHLNGFNVSVGDHVKAGQQIAISGSTGNSTGPHLHYEVRNANDTYNPNLNPRLYLPGSSYSFSTWNDPIPVDDRYPKNYAYTAPHRIYTYTESRTKEGNRWADPGDACTIVEAYTDGFCKIIYPASGVPREAYALISDCPGYDPVEAKPTFSILSANKYNYALGDNIVFTANSDNNAKFTIGINNENGDRLITRDLPGTLTVSSKELGLGTYYAYVTAYNSAGYVDSSGIWFLVSPQGAAMSSGAGQTIPNGDYVIVSEMSQGLYLDIPGVKIPADNSSLINIWEGHPTKGSECDVWTVTYLNNGFYKITQKDTNMALDLYENSLNRGTRTAVRAYNGGTSQQWSINTTKHGYQIQSRSTGWVLDVVGGNATPGTQTNVWEINDSKAQSWGFVPFASDDRPIADGEYSIKSKLANVWLDVWGNYDVESYTNGTNVGICDAITDTFDVKYIGDGYYKILEHNSGLALDVDKPSYLNRGGNIQLYENGSNEKANQLWRIKDMGNGYYCLISKMSGYCIDIAGAVVDNSTNVQQYTFNNHDAQKWSFEKVHNHSYTSKITKEPTCATEGVRTYTCSICNDKYTEAIAKTTTHNFGSWTTTKAATCAAEGTKTRKCSVCGKTENASIAKTTDHKIGDWTVTKAATCAAEGKKSRKCTVCGKTETASIAKTTTHSFGSWTTTKAATCAAEGTKTRKCSICGKTENQTIQKSNKHKYKVETISPTTTEGGYDRHTCTLCGHFYIDNVVPPISVPDNPTVSYEKGDGSVKLTWNTVSGAQKYGIAGYQNGAWQLLDKTTGSSYTLKNLKAGTNYKIAVIAMFNSNWNMDFSKAITVTPNEATVSQYPVVQTQVKDSKIGFKWTKVPGAEKYGIGIYQANKWKVIKQLDGNVTTWTSPQISSGKYRLAVLAKVNGQWVNADVFKKSFYVTVE